MLADGRALIGCSIASVTTPTIVTVSTSEGFPSSTGRAVRSTRSVVSTSVMGYVANLQSPGVADC